MKLSLSATFLAAAYICVSGFATIGSADTLESYGVAGDMDKKNRNPHLTVSAEVGTNQVTILADAAQGSKDFDKYPIQFEFFVNRTLFSTQYRSPRLNGPVGVTVPSSVATVPFNYVVIAKVIHPNSVYTTVIEAAAVAGGSSESFDCTLTLAADTEGEDPTLFTASDVSITQSTTGDSNTKTTAEFTAKSQDDSRTVTISAEAITGDTSNGTVTIAEEGETDITFSGDASIESEDGSDETRSFSIESENDESILTCSK